MDEKIDQAWAELQKLPKDEQEIAAEAILDYAAGAKRLRLSDEQVQEVERRLADTDSASLTLSDARRRFSRSVP